MDFIVRLDSSHCAKPLHSQTDSVMTPSEQRRIPRYNFVATTEMTDEATATCLAGRISEISRKGCYVDFLNALPVGTMLKVQILRDAGTFTSRGKIIYAHEQIGMGITFIDTPSEQLKILDSWLTELSAINV
jgi:hypothetical protein